MGKERTTSPSQTGLDEQQKEYGRVFPGLGPEGSWGRHQAWPNEDLGGLTIILVNPIRFLGHPIVDRCEFLGTVSLSLFTAPLRRVGPLTHQMRPSRRQEDP